MQLQQQDALGGGGSLAQGLLGVIVNGVSRATDGYLSKKFPLTSFNETETLNAAGQRKPSAAPARDVTPSESIAGFVSNPVFIAVGVTLVAATALFLIARK